MIFDDKVKENAGYTLAGGVNEQIRKNCTLKWTPGAFRPDGPIEDTHVTR